MMSSRRLFKSSCLVTLFALSMPRITETSFANLLILLLNESAVSRVGVNGVLLSPKISLSR